MSRSEEISDFDFRMAIIEIAIQAREVSRAWARLRTQLDAGPADERPARLKACQEAYARKSWMSNRVLAVVAALTGTALFPEWEERELEQLPKLLKVAKKRAKKGRTG